MDGHVWVIICRCVVDIRMRKHHFEQILVRLSVVIIINILFLRALSTSKFSLKDFTWGLRSSALWCRTSLRCMVWVSWVLLCSRFIVQLFWACSLWNCFVCVHIDLFFFWVTKIRSSWFSLSFRLPVPMKSQPTLYLERRYSRMWSEVVRLTPAALETRTISSLTCRPQSVWSGLPSQFPSSEGFAFGPTAVNSSSWASSFEDRNPRTASRRFSIDRGSSTFPLVPSLSSVKTFLCEGFWILAIVEWIPRRFSGMWLPFVV